MALLRCPSKGGEERAGRRLSSLRSSQRVGLKALSAKPTSPTSGPGAACSKQKPPMADLKGPVMGLKGPTPSLKDPMPGLKWSSVRRGGPTSGPIAPMPEQKGPMGRDSAARAWGSEPRLRSKKRGARDYWLRVRLSKPGDAELGGPNTGLGALSADLKRRNSALSASRAVD